MRISISISIFGHTQQLFMKDFEQLCQQIFVYSSEQALEQVVVHCLSFLTGGHPGGKNTVHKSLSKGLVK